MNLNININLTNEQKAFVDSTKQFADEHIKNNSLKWDKNSYFPVEVFKKSAELGLAGSAGDSPGEGGSAELAHPEPEPDATTPPVPAPSPSGPSSADDLISL